MANKFELHIGFPDNEEAAVNEFWTLLQKKRKGWSRSEVSSVHGAVGMVDPHNVPGTLKYLISQNFQDRADLSEEEEVLAEAQWILSTLATKGIENARVEIEYVFGYLTRLQESEHGETSLRFLEPPDWAADRLTFGDAERILETPNSEIHFIIERDDSADVPTRAAPEITVDEATQLLKTYGVNIQQTIVYRSQAMREKGSTDRKLICTAYYGSPSLAEREARRLFLRSKLYEDVAARGFTLKLVLERILGCFKPVRKFSAHTNSSSATKPGIQYA